MYFGEENTGPDLDKEVREAEASEKLGKEVEEISEEEFQDRVNAIIPEDHSELGFALAKIIENYEALTGDEMVVLGILSHLKFQVSKEIEDAGGPVASGAVTDTADL